MRRKLIITCVVVATVLLSIYLGVAFYFNSHYMWNTTINSINFGGKTADYAVSKNTEISESYRLSITDRAGNIFSLNGADFLYKYVSTGEEEKILKSQNPFTWPVSVFKANSYTLQASSSYDIELLKEKVDTLAIFSSEYIEQPQNASIQVADGTYSVVPEVLGTVPIYEQIFTEIQNSLDAESKSLTLSDSCYEKPQITSESDIISNAIEQLDRYTSSTITYDIEGSDEKLSSSDILDMIIISDDYSVTLDDTKITQYVQKLASTYNTYGRARDFLTSSGDSVRIGGGDYGWIISKSKEKEQLIADLSGGAPVEREPVYEQTARYRGNNDIGNTYIEIDYTKQHMWYYKDGTLVMESDLVSGNLARNNGSVDGVFKIAYKERNATLNGENYSTPVNYFMPFAYNIGIHDAGWRSSFGGETYRTSGSHGCINVPPAFAESLYNTIEIGTPVIAYYREPVALTNNAAKVSNAYSYVKSQQ